MSDCELCGHPMPKGEEMFKYHGFSGPCPRPYKIIEQPLKKTFVTYWSKDFVVADKLTNENFYEETRGSVKAAITPEDIPYLQLLSFLGKKTKVTIEVLE